MCILCIYTLQFPTFFFGPGHPPSPNSRSVARRAEAWEGIGIFTYILHWYIYHKKGEYLHLPTFTYIYHYRELT